MHDLAPTSPDPASPSATLDVLRLAAAELRGLGPALRLQAASVDTDELSDELAEQFQQVMTGFSTMADTMASEVDDLATAYAAARPGGA